MSKKYCPFSCSKLLNKGKNFLKEKIATKYWFHFQMKPMKWFIIAFVVFIVLVGLYFLMNTNLIA